MAYFLEKLLPTHEIFDVGKVNITLNTNQTTNKESIICQPK